MLFFPFFWSSFMTTFFLEDGIGVFVEVPLQGALRVVPFLKNFPVPAFVPAQFFFFLSGNSFDDVPSTIHLQAGTKMGGWSSFYGKKGLFFPLSVGIFFSPPAIESAAPFFYSLFVLQRRRPVMYFPRRKRTLFSFFASIIISVFLSFHA